MRYAILSILVISSALGAGFAQNQGTKQESDPIQKKEPKPKVVSVTEFRTSSVIGHLGHPLGTIVRVTGTAIDGNTTRVKKYSGKTLLKIQTANGHDLDSPVTFEFMRAERGIDKPKARTKFDYYVHEYGQFDGVVAPPTELNIKSSSAGIPNDGFYYRRHITIHKSM
jgi:hypothetical protein